MKRLKILKVFILILLFFSFSLYSQIADSSLTIVMIDVSGSMVGRGDGRGIDIFGEVKNTASQVVKDLNEETFLRIIPFHRGVEEDNIFRTYITDEQDKGRAVNFIRNLRAEGHQTWLTASFNTVKDVADRVLQNVPDSEDRLVDILIFTDGRGNGPGDEDIKNFIRSYKMIKTDYPHLYTRFISIGNIFSEDEKEKFKETGIEEKEYDREEFKTQRVNVSPSVIRTFNFNKSFELEIETDEGLIGEKLSFSIECKPVEKIGSNFKIKPSRIILKGKQIKKFNVRILNEENLKNHVQKSGKRDFQGKIEITAKRPRVIINPRSNLVFVYSFEPKTLKVGKPEKDTLINTGTLILPLKEKIIEGVETTIEAVNTRETLKFKPKNHEVKVRGEYLKVPIIPESNKKFHDYRWGLEEEKIFPVSLKVKSEDVNYSFKSEEIQFFVKVTPSKLKGMLPFIWFIGGALFIFLTILIVLKAKTASFPEGAQLTLPDGSIEELRTKLGRDRIYVGEIGSDDDIEVTFGSSGETLFEIFPGSGNSISVDGVGKGTDMKDPSGNASNSFSVNPNENFKVIESSNEYSFHYEII